jgi:hypothetical protein
MGMKFGMVYHDSEMSLSLNFQASKSNGLAVVSFTVLENITISW